MHSGSRLSFHKRYINLTINDMLIDMGEKAEIPCASCQSWARKQKKFSCNPDDCKGLTAWLFENVPQLCKDNVQLRVSLPEIANQYVV